MENCVGTIIIIIVVLIFIIMLLFKFKKSDKISGGVLVSEADLQSSKDFQTRNIMIYVREKIGKAKAEEAAEDRAGTMLEHRAFYKLLNGLFEPSSLICKAVNIMFYMRDSSHLWKYMDRQIAEYICGIEFQYRLENAINIVYMPYTRDWKSERKELYAKFGLKN